MGGVSILWKTSNACESFSFPVCIGKRKVCHYTVRNTEQRPNRLVHLGRGNQNRDNFPKGHVEWVLWELSQVLRDIVANGNHVRETRKETCQIGEKPPLSSINEKDSSHAV